MNKYRIAALPTRRPQLEIVPLGHDELVVAAPPGHSIARRARCPLAALHGQPFIGFDRDIPTRRLVDRLLRRNGVRVSYVMELDNIETIKRSVEAGLGLSLLPAPTLVAEIRARTLVGRPIASSARAGRRSKARSIARSEHCIGARVSSRRRHAPS